MEKIVQHIFELYEDVDAAHSRASLDRYPVALVVDVDLKFSECKVSTVFKTIRTYRI